MSSGIFKIRKGIQLVPNTGSVVDTDGEIAVNDTSDKLEVRLDGVTHSVVTEGQSQTLTSKTLTSPTINTADINGGTIDNATITGGDAVTLANLSINDNSTHDLAFDTNSGLTSDRTLTFDVNDANRTIDLSGNLTVTGNATISGDLTGSNSGDVTLTAVGSSPNANAASLTGQQLQLQPADASNPGVVTTGAQTFGGVKTLNSPVLNDADLSLATAFPYVLNVDASGTYSTDRTLSVDMNDADRTLSLNGNLTVSSTSTISGSSSGTNTGDVTLSAVGSNPNANGATLAGQTLNLEPASSTTPGVVTALAQSFGGAKTFIDAVDGLSFSASSFVNSHRFFSGIELITAAGPELPKPGSSFIRVNTATTVESIVAPTDGSGYQLLVIYNETGSTMTIANNTGATTANRILTGTGGSITVDSQGSVLLAYFGSSWRVVGGSGSGGSYFFNSASTQTVSPSGTITIDPTKKLQTVKVTGANAGTNETSNTLFGTGTFADGTTVRVMGTSNTNSVLIGNFNNTKGAILNGYAELTQYRCIELQYDLTANRWIEISRNF